MSASGRCMAELAESMGWTLSSIDSWVSRDLPSRGRPSAPRPRWGSVLISGISAGGLNPASNVPMLSTHKSWKGNRRSAVSLSSGSWDAVTPLPTFAEENMLPCLTVHWRATRRVSLVISVVAVTTSILLTRPDLGHFFHIGFILIGSLIAFGFGYTWPFLVRTVDLVNRRLIPGAGAANHWGIKFFFWAGLIALPLITIDNLIPAPTSDLAFGVAACTGLIAGCCHSLATQKAPESDPAE